MQPIDALQYVLLPAVVTALVRPVGGYLERVFSGRPTLLDPFLGPLERGLHGLSGVDPQPEVDPRRYDSGRAPRC